MSSSTLIELRELNLQGHKKNPNLQPGECEIILKQPLIIEKGSSLGLKSGFIDSVDATSGKINIPENNSYSISYYIGFQHYSRDGKRYNNYNPPDQGNPPTNPEGYPDVDNKLYFPCSPKGAKDPGYDHVILKELHFKPKSVGREFGEYYPINVTYTDEYGNSITHQYKIPRLYLRQNEDAIIYLNGGVARLNTVHISSPSWHEISKNAHVSSYFFVTEPYTPPAGGGIELEPKLFKLTFSLPPGDYKPAHLADLLTEACTSNINTVTTTGDIITVATNNAFLKSTDQIDVIINTESGTTGTTTYVCEDGSRIITYPKTQIDNIDIFNYTSTPKVVGTDQFSFEYDSDIDKIVLAQSHSNIYNNGSGGGNMDGDPIIKIMPNSHLVIPQGTVPTPHFTTGFWATRNGVALVASMEPPSFWFGELGLDPSLCIVAKADLSVHPPNTQMGGYAQNVTTFGFGPIVDGVNVTNSFISTSLAIQKNLQFNNLIDFNYLESITTANTKIYGMKTILNAGTNDGYFLISIDSFGSKFLGEYEINNTIKEVVTTFYQTENFTSFDSNSTPYIHDSDEPLVISSFKVRILTPNMELASIGPENTIFLEYLKPIQKQFITEL